MGFWDTFFRPTFSSPETGRIEGGPHPNHLQLVPSIEHEAAVGRVHVVAGGLKEIHHAVRVVGMDIGYVQTGQLSGETTSTFAETRRIDLMRMQAERDHSDAQYYLEASGQYVRPNFEDTAHLVVDTARVERNSQSAQILRPNFGQAGPGFDQEVA